jgi:HAD superfamily hydrolase (TIGR01549 family)
MYSVTQRNWRVEREAAQTLRAVQQRGFRIGAVSNGSDDWNAQRLIDRARLRRYFELVLTSAAHGWRKPDGRIFQAALDYFHAEPGEAVMIGDSYEADILGAGALGIRTMWITKRAATADVRPTTEPDATLRTLKEIPGLLS